MESLGLPTTGLTRIGFVRVEVGDGAPTCHVVGTLRHRLVARPVPVGVATALIAQGVPSVVRHPDVHRPVAAQT